MPFRGLAPIPDGAMKWRAKWIWIPGKPRPVNFYLCARKVFELRSAPGRAVLYCTADSRYKLYVNGRYIGRGPARCLPAWQSYDEYDVTSALKRGKNTIGFIVHHFGEVTAYYVPGRGGLICQLEADMAGSGDPLISDETWRVAQAEDRTSDGVRMGPYLGFQEVHDARLSRGDWTASAYDDSDWQQPEVLGRPPVSPWERLEPRIAPRFQEISQLPAAIVWARKNNGLADALPEEIISRMATEELSPLDDKFLYDRGELLVRRGTPANPALVKCPRDGGVSLMLDFGKQVFGTFELRLRGSAGGVVDIGYAETLNSERMAERPGDALCADRYIMRRGRQVWHTFEPRCFRYVQMDFRDCPGQVAIERVQIQRITYDTGRAGDFECSDQALNRVWAAGVNTLKLCVEDAIVNSPRRERRTTWEDLYFAARGAYFAFGDSDLLSAVIRQGIQSQNADGMIPAWTPAPIPWEFDPVSALFFVWCAVEYCDQTGDQELLGDLLTAVERLLSWFSGHLSADGLLRDVASDGENHVEECGLNCLYRESLRRAARLAEAAGRSDLAKTYRDVSDDVRLAINKFLWSSRGALYGDARVSRRRTESFSRETNVLALFSDVPDHYQRAALIRQLESENDGLPHITSTLYASLLSEALCRLGKHEDAVKLISEGWGHMAGDTFWESFDGSSALCRAFAVGPVADLSEHILGARPVSSTRLRIAPHIGGLAWARGIVPTRSGDVTIEWKSNRERFAMRLQIPAGSDVEVVSPVIEEGAVMILDGAKVVGNVAIVGEGRHIVEATVRKPKGRQPLREDIAPPPSSTATEAKPARWTAPRTADRATRWPPRRRPREVPAKSASPPEATKTEARPRRRTPRKSAGAETTRPARPRTRGSKPRSENQPPGDQNS